MITPDDPRHGTVAGYKAHKGVNTCQPCKDAEARYKRHRLYDREHGLVRLVPAIGFSRRVHALQALGWACTDIGPHLGISDKNVWRIANRDRSVTVRHHNTMVKVYNDLCMTVPTGWQADKLRALAARRGWAPPLAWDHIDDPDETPDVSEDPDLIDEVAIQRRMNGDRAVYLTVPEKRELWRRWDASGRVLGDMERVTGISDRNIFRDRQRSA